jgi:APA family basic amino acid/polyamine antiporter
VYVNPANNSPFIPPPATGGEAEGGITQSLLSLFGGEGTSVYGIYGLLAAASPVFFGWGPGSARASRDEHPLPGI